MGVPPPLPGGGGLRILSGRFAWPRISRIMPLALCFLAAGVSTGSVRCSRLADYFSKFFGNTGKETALGVKQIGVDVNKKDYGMLAKVGWMKELIEQKCG